MSNRPKTEPKQLQCYERERGKQQVSKRQKQGGIAGERETREEVKCNRGFIVCGSWGGNELSEGGEREQDEGRETVGTARWQKPQRQAELLSQPAEYGLPPKQAAR